MISPELARNLLPLVNDVEHHDILIRYLEDRIGTLRLKLEITQDYNSVLSVQGKIQELRKMLLIRDEVNGVLKK